MEQEKKEKEQTESREVTKRKAVFVPCDDETSGLQERGWSVKVYPPKTPTSKIARIYKLPEGQVFRSKTKALADALSRARNDIDVDGSLWRLKVSHQIHQAGDDRSLNLTNEFEILSRNVGQEII